VRETAVGRRAEPVAGSAGAAALVVVNFGSHALLERNLAGHDGPVVVVDNFRSAADSAAVADLAARRGWTLVSRPNEGFGAGTNAGAAAALAAGAEVLLLVNPDLEVTPAVAEQLRLAALAEPDALVMPRILRPDGTVWFRGGVVSVERGGLRPAGTPGIEWVTAACLAVHRDLWARTGGFAEDYFLYWEDVDLSLRALRAGGRLVVRDDLTAVHDAGGTQGGGRAKSPVYYHWNCRNRLLFAARHLSRRDRLRWLLRTPADARRVVLRGGRRQLVRPDRTVWPALTGSLRGAGIVLRSLVTR
jgi:GT2 family glycosyltransferase